MSDIAIFRKCSCGFSTWFESEEREHLQEIEGDVQEHSFISVIVENHEHKFVSIKSGGRYK
jgi:hypothetical protein